MELFTLGIDLGKTTFHLVGMNLTYINFRLLRCPHLGLQEFLEGSTNHRVVVSSKMVIRLVACPSHSWSP
jgi:hypothetical protein